MNNKQKDVFIKLVHKHNVKFAVNLVLYLTTYIYYESHKIASKNINDINIYKNPIFYPIFKLEKKRLSKNGMPMRYHIMTFFMSHILKHGYFNTMIELFNWDFIRAFYYEIKLHVKEYKYFSKK
jgi:hypothetical protein